MTKKHFQDLADTIKEIRRQGESADINTGKLMQIVEQELARFCQRHNPAFDKDRFLHAAGAK